MTAASLLSTNEASLWEKGPPESSLLPATAGRAAGSCFQPPPKGCFCLWPLASLHLPHTRFPFSSFICPPPFVLRGTNTGLRATLISPLPSWGAGFQPCLPQQDVFLAVLLRQIISSPLLENFCQLSQVLGCLLVLPPSDMKEQDPPGDEPKKILRPFTQGTLKSLLWRPWLRSYPQEHVLVSRCTGVR